MRLRRHDTTLSEGFATHLIESYAMSTKTTSEETLSAPYVGFPTFKNFIKMLSENGVPTTIDKSVMNNLSGGVQSHLTKSLKFLGLIGSDGVPTKELLNLVESYETSDWPVTFSAIVRASYFEIVSGVDVSKASANDLEKCFESIGFKSSSLDKVVRFYVAALKECNIEVSKFIENRKARATRKRNNGSDASAKKDKVEPKEQAPVQLPVDSPPAGVIEYPIYFTDGRTGCIRVPKDIGPEDYPMIALTTPLIEAYAKRNQS